MLGDTGSRRGPEIHTQVKSVGVVNLAKNVFRELGHRHDFKGWLLWQGCERLLMLVRDDQDMPTAVREGIETDEGMFSAIQDPSCFIGECWLHPRVEGVVHRGN